MKRIIFYLLAITCINNCFAYSYTGYKIGDLIYLLSGNNAIVTQFKEDSWYRSNYTNDEYIIPETVEYEGKVYTVTEIDYRAFSYNNAVNPTGSTAKKIVMPNTIKTIGKSAFAGCSNLTSIIIPSSVEKFDEPNHYDYSGTFNYCDMLREIIYLAPSAPLKWTATTYTYVPDKQSYSSPEFSINNAQVIEMITFSETEFTYSGSSPTTTWKNNVDGYTASLSMPTLSGDVGEHEVWIPVSFVKGDESFNTNVVYRYKIKPVKLTAKVENASREYGEDNPTFTISYSGFINGENENIITESPTVMTTATTTSSVGEYAIIASGGSAANYEFVYEPGVLTVTKAPLSAKVNDVSKVYGSQNPAFTIDYYGLKNNESTPAWTTTPTFQTDATKTSGVGEYIVKAVNGAPTNYELGDITSGKLIITPAPLVIKANDAVRKYYDDDPEFSYTCNGFVNNEDESVLDALPTLSTTAKRSSDVGTYEISVGKTTSDNYMISYVNGTLTITQRTLTASVGNYERVYNEENPDFEVKYEGFVGNDTEKVLITKATASTTATKTSDVGTYSITITGGSADNYKLSYTSGVLTINKAEQTISWEQNLSGLGIGDQVELIAEATSGLPITYTLDTDSVAEVYSSGSKKYLDCKAIGKFQIVAIQEGNKNYYSSTRIRKNGEVSENTSISSIHQSNVVIQKMSNGVRLVNVIVDDIINVYSLDGILVKTMKPNSPTIEIPLSKNNVYLLKTNGKTIKFVY